MADSKKPSNLNSIDLSSPDIPTSVSLLKQACMDSGFFYVTNHGISQEFMDQVFIQSKNFFDLPLKEKMKLLRNEKHRGYTPFLDELLDPINQLTGDHKEGFYIGIELPEDDPEAQRTFYGPNVWPDSGINWVLTRIKGVFGCAFRRYLAWMEANYGNISSTGSLDVFREVARKTARLIALALDLDTNFFDQPEMLGNPIATLRLLHYGGQVSEPAKGIYGAGAHSDYGLITLLATDGVPGLQICKDKDAKPQVWEYVEPVRGAFVVNLGDMLERWSNGIFRSTLHRVLGNGQERYSIPYFVEPSHDCVVECLPTCQSKQNPPKYPPIKSETYLLQRYRDTHADLNTYNKPYI